MELLPNQGVKVLRAGTSWHGGDHVWSLPTQAPDGTWTAGDWTPREPPSLCAKGWHLTDTPTRWWGSGDVVAYLAEYDGATDGPNPEHHDDPTKFSVERCRLLRPLTRAELEARGIYLTGRHERLDHGEVVLGGDAVVAAVAVAEETER